MRDKRPDRLAASRRGAAVLLACFLFFCAPADASRTARVDGVVRDVRGDPVAAAEVSLTTATGALLGETVTGRRGAFSLEGRAETVRLRVRKAGFRDAEREVPPGGTVEITLEPASVSEQVTVVATRLESRLGETPASVVVLQENDLRASASPALDDALRQVPGFTLFRRSGSRTANPTSQGVSLRGAGPSGASRALVVDDGLPLNDPFGGWIYWGRVPRASIDRVEVLRGGASDLWGSGALSGVVQLVRREPDLPAHVAVEASYGSQETAEASVFAGVAGETVRASLAAEALGTDGWVPVEEAARGPVDDEAGSRRWALEPTIEGRRGGGRVFVRAGWFEETRENGTVRQENDTRIRRLAVGADGRIAQGEAAARAWWSDQDFHQTFSAVAADRASERLTRIQDVPSDALGLSVQWSRAAASHALLFGVEARTSRGESREEVIGASASTFVTAGGEERAAGAFVRDSLPLGERATLTGAVRFDVWENARGRVSRRDASGAPVGSSDFEDRTESALSPRVSMLFRPGRRATLSASAYSSFRAPTLNELYRGFRVGNVETLANERLDPERVLGAEAGAMTSSGGVFGRAVVFWMEVEDPVANVTLSETPSLVVRQRRNLGRVRSRGVELEGTARLGARWKLSAGYLFADSVVREAREVPELVGRRTPQVARHQASAQVSLDDPDLVSAAVQARWSGPQYEDDRNRFELGAFATVDAVVSRTVTPGLDVFVAAENVLDERYDVGRTPVRSIGGPRSFRAGIRFRRP